MTSWVVAGVVIAGVSAIFAGLATLVIYRMWRSSSRSQSEEEGKWKGRVDILLDRIGEDLERIGKELTELGKTVSEEITAQARVERVADTLNEKVEGKDAYEIQDFCFGYVENTDQYSNEERQAIWNAPTNEG